MKLRYAIQVLDLWTFGWCLKRKHRQGLISISRWLSKSADGYLYLISALVFAAVGQWQAIHLLALSFSLERGLYFLLKNYLKRNRPQQAIPGYQSVVQPADQFSFPSGHTSAAFLMMGIMASLYPFAALPLLIWAIGVGISRVMLGVHFPTDILAGALLGYGIHLLCLHFFPV